jgi:hypothetical protein
MPGRKWLCAAERDHGGRVDARRRIEGGRAAGGSGIGVPPAVTGHPPVG